jgi:type IV pilus assembly protein PilA
MNRTHQGTGVVQVLLAAVGIVALAAVAVPKYQDFLVRSKMSEAFAIVSDTRNKLTEFYIAKNRFPNNTSEITSIKTDMLSAPEFVNKVEVKGKTTDHEVVIQVYFQPEVFPGDGFNDQVLYVAGNTGEGAGAMLQWSCGLRGIEDKYIPSHCVD